MMINKDTKICISIAKKPGNFGAFFHNYLYKEFKINFIYLPIKVEQNELKKAIDAIKVFKIRGCGVSMPHKIKVIEYLDKLDDSALKTGAVNTIVNENGILWGYNTDYYGAKKAIQIKSKIKKRDVLLIGAGGVARAIGLAVKELGGNLKITNRTAKKAEDLAKKLGAEVYPWEKLNKAEGYMLINATSVGMNNPKEMVVKKETISNFKIIKDVVISPLETKLIKEAKKLKKITIPGFVMCVYQAIKQFELYTGKKMPESLIKKMLRKMSHYEKQKI